MTWSRTHVLTVKYIPSALASFKKQAREWRVSVDIAASVPFQVAKQVIESGEATPSLVSDLLKSGGYDEDTIRQTGSAMFASGSAAVRTFKPFQEKVPNHSALDRLRTKFILPHND